MSKYDPEYHRRYREKHKERKRLLDKVVYLRNREVYLERARRRNRRVDAAIGEVLAELKQYGCTRCGFSVEETLEFHHLDRSTKRTNLSQATARRGWTAEKVRTEAQKCIVLCANCHRIEETRLRRVAGTANGPGSNPEVVPMRDVGVQIVCPPPV